MESKYFGWTDLPCKINPSLIECLRGTLKCPYVAKVQKATVPLLLQRKNLVVQACTGSGKTLAYLVPTFQRITELVDEEGVQGMVILPSRELAIQVNQVATQLSKCIANFKVNPLLLIGGYPIEKDLKKYEEGTRLFIGTPGRLYEFIEKSKVSLNDIEIFIMDEGDKLLELADSAKLLKILDLLPSTKTTGVFSATITQNLEKLLSVNLSNALQVTVPVFKGDLSDSSTILASANEYEASVQVSPLTKRSFTELSKKACEVPHSIQNSYAVMNTYMQKLEVISWFIKQHSASKCIVFLSTCACVEYYYYLFVELFPGLKDSSFFDRLHRKMSQKKRDKVYSSFLAAPSGMLLCTDILARGIDIPDVQWIIQYDPPQHSDSFLHRIGRTARAGKKGMVRVWDDMVDIDFAHRKGGALHRLPEDQRNQSDKIPGALSPRANDHRKDKSNPTNGQGPGRQKLKGLRELYKIL
eukprot:TRINITY_DN3492_c0_g1_i5.p1 TRINITY_DN3492_c0_g1~~TRINITY_DN3492_c0_g1_i5.p1  ORF type:complete len:495 (+),score=78.80 TRINITY_DN3492_c0_g1_i5:76-1485(+)